MQYIREETELQAHQVVPQEFRMIQYGASVPLAIFSSPHPTSVTAWSSPASGLFGWE